MRPHKQYVMFFFFFVMYTAIDSFPLWNSRIVTAAPISKVGSSKWVKFKFLGELFLLSKRTEQTPAAWSWHCFRSVYDLWAWGSLCICNQANLHSAPSKSYSVLHRLGLFEPSPPPPNQTVLGLCPRATSAAATYLDSWRPAVADW